MFPGGLRVAEDEEAAAVEAVREVIRSKRLFRFYGVSPSLRGSKTRELENAFTRRMDTAHALAVNSGTSALVCALVGLEIGPGDEVVVPAYTWISTANAVLAVGAVPVVAEVDDSLTIDPADVERKLSPHTKAIVAVHMRGAPARMDVLSELARARGLRLLEDVAQAAGGSFQGRPLGSIGDAGAFSFQISKIMTAGEGGMVTTNDDAVYRRAAMYHDSAAPPHMGVAADEWLPGLNLRMSELHAAVLLVQLGRLDGVVADLRARKRRLRELLLGRLGARVTLLTLNDPAGDTGIALIFFLAEPRLAEQVVSALAKRERSRFAAVPGRRALAARLRRPARLRGLDAAARQANVVVRRRPVERPPAAGRVPLGRVPGDDGPAPEGGSRGREPRASGRAGGADGVRNGPRRRALALIGRRAL